MVLAYGSPAIEFAVGVLLAAGCPAEEVGGPG